MSVEKIDDILREYEEGLKRAMICVPDDNIRKHISLSVGELKFSAESPVNLEDAFDKLRFNQYDLIVIDENFGGAGLTGNEFLKHIQFLPMSIRRYIFVALIGINFKTFSNMQAFEHSVNVVINTKDVTNINIVLKKSIADNEQFYKVFKESLQKFGKR
ncbi:MAG: hypothetical protein N2738_05380 [Thermodesulfovibrionales bacterium]|nr:hypothetical protein [Thermodesulfovibrionales bacterium]